MLQGRSGSEKKRRWESGGFEALAEKGVAGRLQGIGIGLSLTGLIWALGWDFKRILAAAQGSFGTKRRC
jgi:hypothetical protein